MKTFTERLTEYREYRAECEFFRLNDMPNWLEMGHHVYGESVHDEMNGIPGPRPTLFGAFAYCMALDIWMEAKALAYLLFGFPSLYGPEDL